MRVVRTSATGGLGQNNGFLVVDDIVCPTGSVGPCDSMFVDGQELSFPVVAPPPTGTTVSMAQGIYEQRSRGYRLMVRDFNDIVVATPPNLSDAYPVADDTLRLVFDRAVTQASAETEENYGLATLRTILNATRVASNIVHLAIDISPGPGARIEADGDNETVTADAIEGEANGLQIEGGQSRAFVDGVIPISLIQAPDPSALIGNPCSDRSLYSGPGSFTGTRLTFRGVVTAAFGNLYYMSDPGGCPRSSIAMFAPIAPLVKGRQYLVSGAVQEFFTETEGTDNVYLRDEGVAAIPAPSIQTIALLQDTTCDVNQNILNAEDFEGCLVKVETVRVTGSVPPPEPGESFYIAGPKPTYADTMIVADRANSITIEPAVNQSVDVTAILGLFNNFRLNPRNDADVVQLGLLGVDPRIPAEVSLAVYPNPGRTLQLSFGVPRADQVELAVFDIAGRKMAEIVKGQFAPGRYSRVWDGRDGHGNLVSSGVYFYRLKVGAEQRLIQGIRLD
jgi:hypothetical protein